MMRTGVILMFFGMGAFACLINAPDLGGDANLAYVLFDLIALGLAAIGFILFCVGGLRGFVQSIRQKRKKAGFCDCGYDLTGNTSGICPECGTPRES